jgi:hypothetical protein
LDHQILLKILAEVIHDQRFLRLIRHMLKAGYLEDWEYRDTLSGVPQGGQVLDGAQDADDGGGMAASGMLMAAQGAGGWRVFRRRRRLADGTGCSGCCAGRVPAR